MQKRLTAAMHRAAVNGGRQHARRHCVGARGDQHAITQRKGMSERGKGQLQWTQTRRYVGAGDGVTRTDRCCRSEQRHRNTTNASEKASGSVEETRRATGSRDRGVESSEEGLNRSECQRAEQTKHAHDTQTTKTPKREHAAEWEGEWERNGNGMQWHVKMW